MIGAVVAASATHLTYVDARRRTTVARFGTVAELIRRNACCCKALRLTLAVHSTARWLGLTAVAGLATGGALILIWQVRTNPAHLVITLAMGLVIIAASAAYARKHRRRE